MGKVNDLEMNPSTTKNIVEYLFHYKKLFKLIYVVEKQEIYLRIKVPVSPIVLQRKEQQSED